MSQVSFDGYQINQTKLVLTGAISQYNIREILGEEDLTNIVKLTLNSCNGTRLDLGQLNTRLINLREIKIVGMKLNSPLFGVLKDTNAAQLTFERCNVPFAHQAFSSLSVLKSLTHIDIRKAGLNARDKWVLKVCANKIKIIEPSLPKPIFSDHRGVRSRLPESPPTPRINRVKQPRVRR